MLLSSLVIDLLILTRQSSEDIATFLSPEIFSNLSFKNEALKWLGAKIKGHISTLPMYRIVFTPAL
jgi:hypothetical protein